MKRGLGESDADFVAPIEIIDDDEGAKVAALMIRRRGEFQGGAIKRIYYTAYGWKYLSRAFIARRGSNAAR
jgi:hypothetical protein